MLKNGQKVSIFEVISRLGAGAMGEVYRARDTNLGRVVALKVMSAAVGNDEADRRRFNREAQTLAALNHPNIAHIYGYHEVQELAFLSLEFVEGEDLCDRLGRGPLAIDESIAICLQITEGLEAAHRAGIVHRDLKPANVRITPDGHVKILDFGLATLAPQSPYASQASASAITVDAPITQQGTLLGTPLYMSPEQARGLATDHRADIWSLGCVLYECLTGQRAFDGPTIADVIATILGHEPDWEALPVKIPSSIASLLRSCLKKDTASRLSDLAKARAQLLLEDGGESGRNVAHALRRARDACDARNWQAAFELLAEADRHGGLEPTGLELLAECARWLGHNEDIIDPLERAHAKYVADGDKRAAVRTALGLCHANDDAGRRELMAAWWERAGELIAQVPEGPEHALHAWYQNRACGALGDLDGQEQNAERALELARRYGDRNVEALALIDLAHVAAVRGENAHTFERIKQATSLALGGEIDIFATGMVFCNAIWACRCRGEWQRAQEWTESSTRWVTRQQVEYFPGMCRVHRAEVLRVHGELAAAEKECEAATRIVTQAMPAYANFPWAELGEVRRRRGDLSGAMTAFQQSLSLGWDPQPGLALLLLDQGEIHSAHSAIELAFHEPRPTMMREDRANLLSARAKIALAAGATAIAESAVAELETLAARNATSWDTATAAHARGMFELAANNATRASESLARARRIWGEVDAPYELAMTCVLLGQAITAEGDRRRGRLELDVARGIFARISAKLECERTDAVLRSLAGDVPAPTALTHPASPARARIEREGDTWVFDFDGRTVRLQGTRGLEYLAKLLAEPSIDCWAIDLAGMGGAADRGHAGEILDSTARSAYRRRAEQLEEELAATDAHAQPYEVERIRSEMDMLGRQLAAAVGLGGRPRRAGSPVERARQSVTKGIRAAIRKIAAVHPSLGRYLEVTIKTGTACRFDPDLREPIEWRVEC